MDFKALFNSEIRLMIVELPRDDHFFEEEKKVKALRHNMFFFSYLTYLKFLTFIDFKRSSKGNEQLFKIYQMVKSACPYLISLRNESLP